MRIRTFDELTPSMDSARLLVHLSSLGGAADRNAVRLWRARSDLFSDYVGVFAVERGEVLGQTLVKRLAYTFPGGTERIAAVASVGTRPDRARHGVARRLLEEVHRREREAGVRFVSLWTNFSWGAHRLYEQLGYRDTYAFPWAVRRPRTDPGARRAPGSAQPATLADLEAIERLHDRLAEGRLGFCRRPRRFLRLQAMTREVDPARELLVVRRDRAVTGYAHLQSTATRTISGELMAGTRADRVRLVQGVERRAHGAAVAFQHTPITDDPALFRRRGYARMGAGWYVFMTADLSGSGDSRAPASEFAVDDPRFLCLSGDRF